jgi:hypothetical protein
MMEIFKCKDGKVVVYDAGSARVVDIKELTAQKADIEKRLKGVVEPTEKEVLEWAKRNYPMTDHSAERAELSRIDAIISMTKG